MLRTFSLALVCDRSRFGVVHFSLSRKKMIVDRWDEAVFYHGAQQIVDLPFLFAPPLSNSAAVS